MTRTPLAGAGALLLLLGLTACSDDAQSTSATSSSAGASTPTATPTGPPEPRDRSAEVFDAYSPPEVLASTSGSVSLGISSGLDSDEVTFAVTGVRATEDATVLHYQLTAADGEALFGMEGRFWYHQPALQLPGSDTQLLPVTAAVPEGDYQDAEERCVCTSVRFAGPDPRAQTVLYPPLPTGATEVQVTLPGLEPVTVPVTR